MTVSTHDYVIVRAEREMYLKAFMHLTRKLSLSQGICCGYCARKK